MLNIVSTSLNRYDHPHRLSEIRNNDLLRSNCVIILIIYIYIYMTDHHTMQSI
jgi:hypothetical protein